MSHTHTHTYDNSTSVQCIFKWNTAVINCQGQLHTRQLVTVVSTNVVRSTVRSPALLGDLWPEHYRKVTSSVAMQQYSYDQIFFVIRCEYFWMSRKV